MTVVAWTHMHYRRIWKKEGIVLVCSVVALAAALAASPGTAFAYTADDPAVRYHCFVDQNEDGVIDAADEVVDEETGERALVPCEINAGDNAWMLTASALVLVMTPAGLAMFYGGLSRQKNAVNTIHMVFITTGIVAAQFVLWGYSLAFGPDAGGYGFIGTLDWVGLQNVLHDVPSNAYGGITGTTIPHQTFMVFQMMFAIITPALIVASLAERMKFSAFVIFVVIWATFVYDFAAHWTWQITAPDNYGMTPGYCNLSHLSC
jgi:Amt family ammonium transporter